MIFMQFFRSKFRTTGISTCNGHRACPALPRPLRSTARLASTPLMTLIRRPNRTKKLLAAKCNSRKRRNFIDHRNGSNDRPVLVSDLVVLLCDMDRWRHNQKPQIHVSILDHKKIVKFN